MDRVVVVGASLAAVHAVEALREHGYAGDIALVGAEDVLPYDRPPLSKEALREGVEPDKLLLRDPGWYDGQGVTLRLGRAAIGLDTRDRAVVLEGGGRVPYDGVVLATGSRARTVTCGPPAAERAVRSLRSLEDAVALRQELLEARSLVVIGAGFIGLEVAATAREMGLEVTVVELAPVPLARVLGDEVGHWFRHYHAQRGVDVRCGVAVDEIERSAGNSKVRLRDGTVLSADLVVAGVGAAPATDWLAGSGLGLGDGVRCDEALRTTVPDVVAAGDVATWYNPLFDETMRVEQWNNAVIQGRHAAGTLLGGGDACAVVPYFWSDQFEARMRFVGRSNAASDVRVVESSDRRLVALFGRDGKIRGALCVNAPRQLARYRKAIEDQVPWGDVD
ncbi:NAD(P)/FAD-dependent oxidoreductase [Micromonospora sp. DT47]|uniref:NAD(P)/FAD-dependent oxidoreductase n=1 Tax=Micromonospora sp. DT47 TaxID=3393431 RepID=UPI003CE83B12